MLQQPLLDDEAKPDQFQSLRLFATVLAVSLGSSLQFGFATGSLNNLEQIVPKTLEEAGNPIDMTKWALINSCFSVGGLIGSYGVVAPLAYFGRKKTLLMTNVFVFLSSALLYYGTVWWVLVLGRMAIGVVAGVAQMVAGAYMTEISPIGIRGSVGVCSQVGIVIGIALANFLTAPSFNMLGSMELWRYLWLVPVGFSLFQMVVLPFCPESPAYLIKAKGEKATFSTLMKLHREASAASHMCVPPVCAPAPRREHTARPRHSHDETGPSRPARRLAPSRPFSQPPRAQEQPAGRALRRRQSGRRHVCPRPSAGEGLAQAAARRRRH